MTTFRPDTDSVDATQTDDSRTGEPRIDESQVDETQSEGTGTVDLTDSGPAGSSLRQVHNPRPVDDRDVGAGRGSDSVPENVARVMQPLVESMVGPLPIRIEFWDGSGFGPDGDLRLRVLSPDAIRRILWAPGELGIGRAYVAGEVDFDGDVFEMISTLRPAGVKLRRVAETVPAAVAAARRLGLVGRPLPPPPEEARPPLALRHTKRRDSAAISHHYDVGNRFYELVLGEAMTYSCAFFDQPEATLAEAQAAKHGMICCKLGLHERPGMRLLDVGCGWGSMAMHAAEHHEAEVVAITISREQADYAEERVRAAGLADRVEIRCQDYRDLSGTVEQFDAISSIGMFEHVGRERLAEYFETLHSLLAPTGRLLNHAISSVGGSRLPTRSFVYRYVFPDGELMDVGDVVLAMQAAGFEVRDVEGLREHYEKTLRHWVGNLEENWDEAVSLVGLGRARVWLLYMAASSVGFGDGGLGVHQVLGVVPDGEGSSGMPPTRRGWV